MNKAFTIRIYSINHPGCLFNFGTMRMGAYLRWVLIRVWALIIFPTFSASKDSSNERIAKQGISSLFRFEKTKQSGKATINK